MNKDFIKYGLLIALLPVLQEMIFNHINLFGFVNPLVYIIFIFLFPFYKSKTWVLTGAFVLGLLIDMITNDGGIHTFALVFVAYFRVLILRFIKGTSFADADSLNIYNLGNTVQFVWILIVTFIHHFIVFFLEQFSFHGFGNVLLKTFLTTILTSVLITFGIHLFMKNKSNVW